MAGMSVSVVAAWLLTYLVHSTLLLGGVALLTRRVVRRESLRETLWKAALLGGVVSATLAVAVPRPGVARIDLAALGVEQPRAAGVSESEAAMGLDRGGYLDADPGGDLDTSQELDVDVDVDSAGGAALSRRSGGERWEAGSASVGSGSLESAARRGSGAPVASASAGQAASAASPGTAGPAAWLVGLVAVWAAVAALLLARLGYRHLRLRLLLRDRRQVPGSERVASVLTELRRTAGVWKPVRLTSTPAVATPLALGSVEICVPERFLSELGEEEQRAALAHELAHLARRDPLWQVTGSVVGALLFFQPLNAVACRAIRSAAEYMADGWAVAQTGSRVELARCLAAVAGWVAPSGEPALAGTVAMAEGGSPLLARVQRLLDREPEPATRPALRVALAGGLIMGMAGFGPIVGSAPAPAEDGREWSGVRDEGRREVRESTRESLQDPLEVHHFDRPGVEGDGFVARLNEAGRDARQSPYWVAYAIPTKGAAQRLVMDSEPWSTSDLGGPSLAAMLGVEAVLTGRSELAVVLVRLVPRGGATGVERITLRRPELGMRLGGAVYWLGLPEPGPSFRWFRDIYQAVDDPGIREAAVEAMGVHDVPEAAAFLERVLAEDGDHDLREEAMEGLVTLRPDTALARLLFDLAMTDPDERIRHEATEQLGRVGEPMAVSLLERLAWESEHVDVQRQAAESLGEAAGPGVGEVGEALARLVESHPSLKVRREALDQMEAVEGGLDGNALLAMALRSDEPDLRREAVELMERLPAEEAVSFLGRAVFESGDGTVERQAAETLGEVRTAAALEVLLEILARNPSEDASFQAVESIAENFPRDVVIAALREVVSNHPSSRVRREALDQLGDLGG